MTHMISWPKPFSSISSYTVTSITVPSVLNSTVMYVPWTYSGKLCPPYHHLHCNVLAPWHVISSISPWNQELLTTIWDLFSQKSLEPTHTQINQTSAEWRSGQRVGPITQRSLDRNQAPLQFHWHCATALDRSAKASLAVFLSMAVNINSAQLCSQLGLEHFDNWPWGFILEVCSAMP